MPDGYGDGHVDRYDDTNVKSALKQVKLTVADHLRHSHGMPMHEIAKQTGIPFKELKERYR